MHFYSTFGIILIDLLAIVILISIIPGLLPNVTFTFYRLNNPVELTGALQVNNDLENVTKLLEGKVLGPESFAEWDGYIYTGVVGGAIIKFRPYSTEYSLVSKVGQPCEEPSLSCGRPLGLRMVKNGILWVAETNSGIYRIDITNEPALPVLVYSSKNLIAGKQSRIINSVDVASDGILFWTDSSTNGPLEDILIEYLGDPSGRVIMYNPTNQSLEVLADNLHFPNGIQLSNDESYVMVAETFRASLHKIYVRGPKKGVLETVSDNLPGFPDNIKRTRHGTYLLAILVPRTKSHVGMSDYLPTFPRLRKLALRTLYLTRIFSDALCRVLPGKLIPGMSFNPLGSWAVKLVDTHPTGLVLELDELGNILKSYHAPSGIVHWISEAVVLDNLMVLGSPYNDYVGVVQLTPQKQVLEIISDA